MQTLGRCCPLQANYTGYGVYVSHPLFFLLLILLILTLPPPPPPPLSLSLSPSLFPITTQHVYGANSPLILFLYVIWYVFVKFVGVPHIVSQLGQYACFSLPLAGVVLGKVCVVGHSCGLKRMAGYMASYLQAQTRHL